ncbi:hypothetical protein [Actinobacillus pleuropneumoniae]|uniref:Lipoprotein HlpB n=2 Tax=Actinobacillus pleuropneumoniae TaxID=715 RepID=A0A448TXD8_ACTPL|nr:hypothetical protein [Actinobacillus pleuropneumoniae]ABY68939.1 lipoprotein HlpB [Actinobacillus pleuropneumoniae serovar 3 str. JL03]ASU16273.1 hypothetical protein CHY23_01527 [Actinobacillus pleuropneumoniae]EFL78735.1 lipoprotein HlpB [Actinobacillus pleuropneumoniae serovar 2 str. 4226]EFM88325.1 hypothetical protein appser2_3230 [Actinobacillus pleuropneumoniae serovar 2 str. S1536]EFM94876.1 hypothetical protein appser9_3580 [Actinobacillus pleuropneumoniae serovar 9 str. CVJ13261]
MKKLATIGAVALLAFSVTACNKADPAVDYKKFQEWYQVQEQTQATAQAELQKQLTEVMSQAQKDPKALEAVLNTFAGKVQETLKSLDAVDVKSAEIKALKDKTKAVLGLSNEVISEQVKVMAAPTAEAQQAIQAKATQLNQAAQELQKLQADLKAKFEK